jgi:6-phosphofructokinase 1
MTAQQVVVSYLNTKGLSARGMARGQVSGTDQRSTAIYASTVDLEEAYEVGAYAVEVARRDGNGWMSTILRKPGKAYAAAYDKVPLEQVANSERTFPAAWLSPNRIDVTDDFVNYALPLIGQEWARIPLENGLQRFARFQKIFADRKCPPYLPEGYR